MNKIPAPVMALICLLPSAVGAAGENGVIRGCIPLTLTDAGGFRTPTFDEYSVKDGYEGRPARVLLDSPEAKMFRTRLRQGAAEGPNFAAHYTVVIWGCGAGCTSAAIVDARSGRTYFPDGIGVIDRNHVDGESLVFRRDSRLLVVLGAPDEDEAREGIAYYEWTGKKLKRLLFLRSVKSFCDHEGWGAE